MAPPDRKGIAARLPKPTVLGALKSFFAVVAHAPLPPLSSRIGRLQTGCRECGKPLRESCKHESEGLGRRRSITPPALAYAVRRVVYWGHDGLRTSVAVDACIVLRRPSGGTQILVCKNSLLEPALYGPN